MPGAHSAATKNLHLRERSGRRRPRTTSEAGHALTPATNRRSRYLKFIAFGPPIGHAWIFIHSIKHMDSACTQHRRCRVWPWTAWYYKNHRHEHTTRPIARLLTRPSGFLVSDRHARIVQIKGPWKNKVRKKRLCHRSHATFMRAGMTISSSGRLGESPYVYIVCKLDG